MRTNAHNGLTRCVRFIRSAFKHDVRLNLAAKNPAVGVPLPRQQRREIRRSARKGRGGS